MEYSRVKDSDTKEAEHLINNGWKFVGVLLENKIIVQLPS